MPGALFFGSFFLGDKRNERPAAASKNKSVPLIHVAPQ